MQGSQLMNTPSPKDKDQKQPEASPDLFIMPTQTVKPPKPYITKHFDSTNSDTLIIYAPKDKQRHNTITAQQEHNTTVCKNLE